MNFGVTSLAALHSASSRAARYSLTARLVAARGQTRGTLDAIAVAGVDLDQTGIDGKFLATNEALVAAALQDSLEQPPQ
jgi:hypothetical protein